MKKILILLVALASIASAEWVLGANIGYGEMEAEATYAGNSAKADTKYTSLQVQGGYQWESIRALAFVGTDNYKDDMVVSGEGNANYIGAELDIIFPVNDKISAYIGGSLAKGEKDFIIKDVEFDDKALKVGALLELNDDIQAEIAIQYKKREYNDYIGIGMDDELIGIVIGLNFNL